MQDAFYAGLFVMTILYGWSAVCFFFFRFSRAETESRMRDFLKAHRSFFSNCGGQQKGEVLTKKTMQKAILWGWVFPSSAFFLLYRSDWNYRYVLISMGLLFFSGLFFALGWYGMRCLRLLGLDSETNEKEDKHE
jgi:hypothetical protein